MPSHITAPLLAADFHSFLITLFLFRLSTAILSLILYYPLFLSFAGTPVILIGTKLDMRDDETERQKLASNGQEPISYNQVRFGKDRSYRLKNVRAR